MRLPAPERRDQLQDAVTCTTRQTRQHILEQGAEPVRDVGGPEKMLGLAVHHRDVRIAIGERAKVQREDVLGEVLREHVGMKRDDFDPGRDAIGIHAIPPCA